MWTYTQKHQFTFEFVSISTLSSGLQGWKDGGVHVLVPHQGCRSQDEVSACTKYAQNVHKVCTKYAQGCIQAIQTAKCANYASMHMPATCTGLHNLQIVRVRKFMCLHNMSKQQSVQKCKVCKFCAVCKMHACYIRRCTNPSACLMCIWYKLHSVPTKCAKYA